MNPNYKLLSNVRKRDAQKDKPINIKQKFNKLTLTSTKKKDILTTANPEKSKTPTPRTLTYSSASSNDDLLTDDESIKENIVNRVLLSSSSAEKQGNKSKAKKMSTTGDAFSQKLEITDSDVTNCTSISAENRLNNQMENLEITPGVSADLFSANIESNCVFPENEIVLKDDQLLAKMKYLDIDQQDDDANSIVVLSISSTTTSQSVKGTNTRSSLSDNEIYDLIEISDSNDENEIESNAVHNVSTIHTESSGLNQMVMDRLNNFFDNIPEATQPQSINKSSIDDNQQVAKPIAESIIEKDLTVNSLLYVSTTTEEDVLNDIPNKSQCLRKDNYLNVTSKLPKTNYSDDDAEKVVCSSEIVKCTPCISKNKTRELLLLTPKNTSTSINISAIINIKIKVNGLSSSSESLNSVRSNTNKSFSKEPKCSLQIHAATPTSKQTPQKIMTKPTNAKSVRKSPRIHASTAKHNQSNLDCSVKSPISSNTNNKQIYSADKWGNTKKLNGNQTSVLVKERLSLKQLGNYSKDINKKPIVSYTPSDDSESVNCDNKTPSITKNKSSIKQSASDQQITELQSNVIIDESSQAILNELYGNTWRTPDILKICTPMDKIKKTQARCSNDFSLFQRDINCDLESTRIQPVNTKLTIPKTKHQHQVPQSDQKDDTSTVTSPFFKKPNENWRTSVEAANKSSIIRSCRKGIVKPISDNDSDSDNNEWNGSDSYEDTLSSGSSTPSHKNTKSTQKKTLGKPKNQRNFSDDLIYLDLTTNEALTDDEHVDPIASEQDLNEITRKFLGSCEFNKMPYVPALSTDVTPKTCKPARRKLYTPKYDELPPPPPEEKNHIQHTISINDPNLQLKQNIPKYLIHPLNKLVDTVKMGDIGQIHTPSKKITTKKRDDSETPPPIKTTPKIVSIPATPKHVQKTVTNIFQTPDRKYGFLQSLDVHISKNLCHPDALPFRNNFKSTKDELIILLFNLYNDNIFDGKLIVPIKWNKKLKNTAGRCINKKKIGIRSSSIELSDKVLTSCDRLRCTLIHEICHAATWIFAGENGHGVTWKSWARKATEIFPELPKISVCHQYDIEYKYTYKCTMCGASSHAHSKAKKVENIRCSYCHGSIEIFLNKKDKDGNVVPTPVRKATGFAMFVKEKYHQFKVTGCTHADVMKMLSNEFAALSVDEKKKY